MRLLTCGTKSHQTSISDLKCSALSSEQNNPKSICSTPRMIVTGGVREEVGRRREGCAATLLLLLLCLPAARRG